MPSRTATNGTTPTPAAKRFELPVLDFKFASLTEGTDIPPPLPSPIEEEPSQAETAVDAKNKEDGAAAAAASIADSSPDLLAKAGKKRPAEDMPMSPVSPTMSNRPGSIRRLFSRNLLNATYANGQTAAATTTTATATADGNSTRPPSRSTTGDKRSKRGSGWFRRLRGGDYELDRSSGAASEGNKKQGADQKQPEQQPSGPPPPMIPELREIEASVDLKDGSSLGTDLFKDIK